MKKRKQNIIPLSNTTLKKIVTRVMEEKSKEPKTIHERIERQFAEANKVLNEQNRPEDYGGRRAGEGAREKKKADPTAIFVSLIERLSEYVEKFRKTPNYTLGSEGIGKDSEFKSYVNKIRKAITKVR